MDEFKTESYGKWILCGEHSVLRGGGALVFPLLDQKVELIFKPHHRPLEFKLSGFYGEVLNLFFSKTFRHALSQLQREDKWVKNPTGTVEVINNIPLGAGKGGSAAICMVITNLFVQLNLLDKNQRFNFAKSLEDLFHGESSGVDLAATMSKKGVWFKRPDQLEELHLKWKPHLALSYCGEKGVTSECVNKVKTFLSEKPSQGALVDEQMISAVRAARNSLTSENKKSREVHLKQALDMAKNCFEQWQLMSPSLVSHGEKLTQMGATAWKPTGSGAGGFVLSLWDSELPNEFAKEHGIEKVTVI